MMMLLWRSVLSMIGYDCGTKTLNMTTISLLDIDDCDIETSQVEILNTNVFLLQANEYDHVNVLQCKIEISRTVHYCGMHSHVSIVNNAYMEYILPITREACQVAHDHGTLRIGNAIIDGLLPNTTTLRSITLAGRASSDASCAGTQYSDPYGSWDSVVVMGTARISLRSMIVRVKVENNKVYLPSGMKCILNNGNCVDPEGGNTFWNTLPKKYCRTNTFSVLFNGPAKILKSKEDIVYTVNVEGTSFSLSIKGIENSCGLSLFKTEHPKLFIMEGKDLSIFGRNTIVDVKPDNMDMFLYVNAKFIYVERHVRSQLKTLYRDVMIHRCRMEKEVLKNSLAIASILPDEFAYRFMKGPGFMAVLAGEVIHIVQCVPVEVKVQHTEECFDRVPILRGNQSFFLTPKTHIITNHATQIPCNSPLLQYYRLGSTWYKLMPRPIEALPPISLKPDTQMTWTYSNPTHLATSGIYTEDDLDMMRNRIMFAMEQKAVLENVAQKITKGSNENIPSVYNLLDEDSLEKLAENAWEKTWGRFVKFGTLSAGFFGIFVLLKICKLIVDTVVHGYTLHTVYGWSIQLIGALWDSITHLLLHLAKTRNEKQSNEGNHPAGAPEDMELNQSTSVQTNRIYPGLENPNNQVEVKRVFVG